jgi:SagB-type dehydrogenase family enzyme
MLRSSAVRKFTAVALAGFALGGFATALAQPSAPQPAQSAIPPTVVPLPPPRAASDTSIEAALSARRPMSTASKTPLTLAEVGQLLWAAQGKTSEHGRRAAPSAGAAYPLEVLVVAGSVTGLPAGVYRYRSAWHDVVRTMSGDCRSKVATVCRIPQMADAAAIFVIVGAESRSAAKFAGRAPRYVALEAGAAGQNLELEAVALGLGSAAAVEFDDAALAMVIGAAPGEKPLLALPVARP